MGQFLCGQQGNGWTQAAGSQQTIGDFSYYNKGYVCGSGGQPTAVHVQGFGQAFGTTFQVCVYDFVTRALLGVSAPITVVPNTPGDLTGPITMPALAAGQAVFLGVQGQTQRVATVVNSGSNNFQDNKNVVANFPFAAPPTVLPAADATIGQEFVVWLEGGLISETSYNFSAALQAPINLAPPAASLPLGGQPPNVIAKFPTTPGVATVGLLSDPSLLAFGLPTKAGALTLAGLVPGLTRSAQATRTPTVGALALTGTVPGVAVVLNGQVAAGQPFSLLAVGGTGFGTKSRALLPVMQENPTPGPMSAAFDPGQTGPTLAGGIYNLQVQPVGFSPTGFDLSVPDPFVSGIYAGCHLLPNNANAGNFVQMAVGQIPFPGAYPFCIRCEWTERFDPNWVVDLTSDQNTKMCLMLSGTSTQSQLITVFDVNKPFAISAITKGTTTVVTVPVAQAANPFGVGNLVAFYGIEGMTQLNGLSGTVTAVGGSNGNFSVTVNINSSAFTAYAAGIPVSNISQATTAVATLNSAATSNPFKVGDAIAFTAVGGMSQINGLCLIVAAIGGAQGAWTVSLNALPSNGGLDTTGFTAYTSGGSAFSGLITAPVTNAMATRQVSTLDNIVAHPFFQYPDQNAHGSFWNQAQVSLDPANGWIRRRIRACITSAPAPGSPGYYRQSDPNGINIDYSGVTDSGANIQTNGFFDMIMGCFARDRGPNNFRYFSKPFVEVSGPGVTGQCATVYVGNANTFAACTILEPQGALAGWADGRIDIAAFNQGQLTTGATVFPYVCTEGGALDTAVVPQNSSFVVGASSLPTISTTALPGASLGVAYSFTPVVTGGTPPYTYYLPTVTPNTGTWLSINKNTGVMSGTPLTAETETVVVSVLDSKGRNTYKRFTLVAQAGPALCVPTAAGNTTWTQAGDQFAFAASPTDAHYVLQFDDWGPMPGGITMQWINHDCWQVTNISRHTEQNGVACYPDITRGFMFNATAMQAFSNPPASNNWTTLSGMGIANSALTKALVKWNIQQTPTTPSVSRWDCLLDLYWFQTNNPAPSATPFIDISIMQMVMDANYYGPTYTSEHGFKITLGGVPYICIIDESDGFNVFNAAGGHYILMFPRPTSATDGLAANSLWGQNLVTHDIRAIVNYFAQSNPVDDLGQPIKNGHTGAVVTAPLVLPSLFFCAANGGIEIDFFQTNTDAMVNREFRVAMQNEPDPP